MFYLCIHLFQKFLLMIRFSCPNEIMLGCRGLLKFYWYLMYISAWISSNGLADMSSHFMLLYLSWYQSNLNLIRHLSAKSSQFCLFLSAHFELPCFVSSPFNHLSFHLYTLYCSVQMTTLKTYSAKGLWPTVTNNVFHK